MEVFKVFVEPFLHVLVFKQSLIIVNCSGNLEILEFLIEIMNLLIHLFEMNQIYFKILYFQIQVWIMFLLCLE